MHACFIASAVSDPVRSYGQQPPRLLRPQHSAGKNTGVGCHCLLQRQRPRSGCQGELQFAGEKGKVSCVSWEERKLVLGGGQTVGSLVLGSSSRRLSLSVSVA